MNLEDQVCSLELSKRLKELGVKQDAYFTWVFSDTKNCRVLLPFCNDSKDSYSAFTVAELGELALKESNIVWKVFHAKNTWLIYSSEDEHGFQAPPDFPEFVGTTEADARAKMLIYLIENKLVNLKG